MASAVKRYLVTLSHITSYTPDALHTVAAQSKDEAVRLAKELYPESDRWEWREKCVQFFEAEKQ